MNKDKKTGLMPAVFLGHGNPMNALSRNAYTEGWAAIGASVPQEMRLGTLLN